MEIPILNGIFTDNAPTLRVSYPINLIPVVEPSGISNGFLKPADGIVSVGTGSGIDRGGINWNNVCYRVMGSKLVTIGSDGTETVLGDVGGTTALVSMDYSFDRLAIASNNNLFYWDGSTLTQVTDGDLGTCLDTIWIDGYHMSTDGEFIVVTELNDPTSVNPLKYGSSEIDPDPIEALLKNRNEVVALNRYTIEYFRNIGGSNFPFQRIEGAQVQKGCVGTHACCIYVEAVAFVGGGRNEQNSVYIASNGQAQKISSRSIDEILEGYTEAQLSTIKVEARNDKSSQLLYVHLPDQTLVYDHAASQAVGDRVWFILSSGLGSVSQYKARNFVYCYNQWLVGDPTSTSVGYLDDTISTHWGSAITWEFATSMVYNGSRGAVIHELELVALTGRVSATADPTISTSYTLDGLSWSQNRTISAGIVGDRLKRLLWNRQGMMRNFRAQRFTGDSSAHITFVRLEAQLEALAR